MRIEAEAQIVKCDVIEADITKIQLKNVVLTADTSTLNIGNQKIYGAQPMNHSGVMIIIPELTVSRSERLPIEAAKKAEQMIKNKGRAL